MQKKEQHRIHQLVRISEEMLRKEPYSIEIPKESNPILHAKNLLSIKNARYFLQDTLAFQLKDIGPENLNCMPSYFPNITPLAIIYRDIQRAGSDTKKISEGLGKKLCLLLQSALFEEAAAVFNQITYWHEKSQAEKNISKSVTLLVQKEKFDRALLAVQRVSSEKVRSNFIKDIVKALIKKDDLDRALSIASSISPNSAYKNFFIKRSS